VSRTDRDAALEVWRAANAARGLAPAPSRIARVEAKLAGASACLAVVRDDGRVVAMALAEPYRDQDGSGPIVVGGGHVSMVFGDPARWGCGIGGRLIEALHGEMRNRGWNTASLWTRASNDRARRLYEGRGYRLTGDVKRLPGGDEILRYEVSLATSPDRH
jgi:GNAT superfamily N-acetyltransferase